jgi:hypothetical protein
VGRTYAIPFSRVWDGALDLVRGELPRWHARWWDEEEGVIQALARGYVSRRGSDVMIRITLDAQAQTRVDLRSTSRSRRLGDFGSNTRLIGAFIAALDRKLTSPLTAPVAGIAVGSDGDGPGISRPGSREPRRHAARQGPRSPVRREDSQGEPR